MASGCRASVCLPVAFIPQTLNRKSCQAFPPSCSAERSAADIKTVTNENESSLVHLKKKEVRQQRIVSYVTGFKPSSKLKAEE